MKNGKLFMIPEEAALVRQIFNRYLSGASLLQLTDFAQRSGLKFRENSELWNKNMIARILDNKKYWDFTYSPIIEQATGQKVLKMRKDKSTPKSDIYFVQQKLVCTNCGSSLSRCNRNPNRKQWSCKICEKKFGPIDDYEILQSITERFLKLCHNPQITKSDQITGISLSMQAVRLSHEIDQMMDRREIDKEKVLSLILECAAEKYKACHSEDDYLTLKIQKLLEGHTEDEKLDQELFSKVVDKVILQPDCSVKLRLINGKIL